MILITGATGYIGRHLVNRLVAQGERPRCLVRDTGRAASMFPASKVEFVQGDTTQSTSLKAAMGRTFGTGKAAPVTIRPSAYAREPSSQPPHS